MQSFAEVAHARDISAMASSGPEASDPPSEKPRRSIAFAQQGRINLREVRAREIAKERRTFERQLSASLAAAATSDSESADRRPRRRSGASKREIWGTGGKFEDVAGPEQRENQSSEEEEWMPIQPKRSLHASRSEAGSDAPAPCDRPMAATLEVPPALDDRSA